MIDAIHGLNVAVRDLDSATAKYETLFQVKSTPMGPEGFAFPGLRGATFDINGFMLNLITSTEPDTSVARFLDKHGEGVFLLSVRVKDLDEADKQLRDKGIAPVMPSAMRGGFGAVNFVHPKQMCGVQLEILELP